MFDRLRPRSRPPKSSTDLWDPKKAATVIEPVVQHWPEVRDQAITLLKAGRDKFSEAYVAVAEVITEKKEAWEDRRAEEKDARQKAARSTETP